MIPKIAILMPSRESDIDLAEKSALILKKRAGMPCDVHILIDKEQIGWQKMINKGVAEIDADYYVYTCADYYPGKEFLKRAYHFLQEKGGSGLVGFNDGKWDGMIATAGLIDKEYLKTLYGGPLLYPEYINHYGDTELTIFAIADGKYYYCPDALLVEVEYVDKMHSVNMQDRAVFHSRKRKGFDRDIPKRLCEVWS